MEARSLLWYQSNGKGCFIWMICHCGMFIIPSLQCIAYILEAKLSQLMINSIIANVLLVARKVWASLTSRGFADVHVYEFKCFAGGQETLLHVERICRCACVRLQNVLLVVNNAWARFEGVCICACVRRVQMFKCFAGGQESLLHVEGVCRCACVRRVQGRIALWEQQVSDVAILFILHIVFNKVAVIEESNKQLQKAL